MENALFDAPGRGRNAEITDDEKAWFINIACQKPIDFGYAAETLNLCQTNVTYQ
ncbi:MAG: helix-turn-helix domain-containing protein [Waltera sp.]